jgi:muramoyltetrapeptide carboxypeptidase
LLSAIDYDLVRNNPKIVVGYSDATALFAALHKKAGLASCFFGPMPGVDLWDEIDPFSEANLWQALTSTKPIGLLQSDNIQVFAGRKLQTTEGRMIGGNLTVFMSLMGTPYQPRFRDAIPFFEEIDEKPRKVDAIFAQLEIAGLWDNSNVVLLGHFTNCDSDADAPTRRLQEIFGDYFSKLGIPILSGLPFGHEAKKWTIAFGAKLRVSIKNGKGSVEVLDSPLYG